MRIFISKTYPIKGAPVYRAYHCGETVEKFWSNDNIVLLVEELEQINPKPEIIFDDDSRLDFCKSL